MRLPASKPFDAVPMAFSRAGGKVPENLRRPALSFRLRGPFRHAELVERPLVVPPVGIHLDAEIEEYLRLEEPFEILPRLGADALDHLAATADDDRLLGLLLDPDRAVDAQQRSRSDSSNSSIATAVENGSSARVCASIFPHHLGGQGAFRLVGQIVVGKDRIAFGELLEQDALSSRSTPSRSRRTRERSRQNRATRRPARSAARAPTWHEIDLVQDEHDRPGHVREKFRDVVVLVARLVDASKTRAITSISRSVSTAASTMRTFNRWSGRWIPGVSTNTISTIVAVLAGSILGSMCLTADAVAGRLRLVGNDRDLGADDPVEQRRLAGVGPADKRDRTTSGTLARSTGASCARRKRTLWMRRLGLEDFDVQAVELGFPTAGTRPIRVST